MKDKQKIELEAIVKEVLKKQDRIIPIIGDDCFVGYIEDGERQILVPIQRWIAEKLLGNNTSRKIKNEIQLEGYHGLDILYEEYKRQNEDDGYGDYKDSIISIVEDGVNHGGLMLRKDVKAFLLAGKFEVVATTCPFHILEKELSIGNIRYNVSSFAPISLTKVSKSEAALKLPSIYQIFGDCEGEFVTGEEDLLKFLHYLNQTDTEKGFGASQLVKYIKDKGQDNKGLGLLMPIGCNNLPNWLFRFLWYPFSQERLIGRDKNNQGGIWHKHSTNENFFKFLRKYRFKTFSDSTDTLREENTFGDPVLERLTKELQERKGDLEKYASIELDVQWNAEDSWDIFLSYASEDLEIAQQIYKTLTNQCNKTVWMDKRGRIKPGDRYWEAIQHGIEHSKTCMFLITGTYLSKAIDKNHRDENGFVEPTGVYQEIDRIRLNFLSQRRDGKAKYYSIPIILEGTKVTYTDLNEIKHENVMLDGALLERLPKFDEYKMLQTDAIFEGVEAMVFNVDNIDEFLTKIYIK